MADKNTVRVTVEYTMVFEDSAVAGLIADVANSKKDTTLWTENFGMFDFEPKESVIGVVVE